MVNTTDLDPRQVDAFLGLWQHNVKVTLSHNSYQVLTAKRHSVRRIYHNNFVGPVVMSVKMVIKNIGRIIYNTINDQRVTVSLAWKSTY